MGRFIDPTILKQEHNELMKYLDSREMTKIDTICLLRNQVDLIQAENTMLLIDK